MGEEGYAIKKLQVLEAVEMQIAHEDTKEDYLLQKSLDELQDFMNPHMIRCKTVHEYAYSQMRKYIAVIGVSKTCPQI